MSYLLLSFVTGRQIVYGDNINSYYPWSATGWSKCRTTKGKYVTSTQWSFIGDKFGSLRDSVCWLADLLAGGFLTAHLGVQEFLNAWLLAPTTSKQYILFLAFCFSSSCYFSSFKVLELRIIFWLPRKQKSFQEKQYLF